MAQSGHSHVASLPILADVIATNGSRSRWAVGTCARSPTRRGGTFLEILRDVSAACEQEGEVPEELFARTEPIERVSGTPAHSLIERWFLDVIARGELVAGDRLPREQDMAAAFGVSRMTLRQALARLQQRGVVDRVPGRSGGTFVIEPKIDCDLTGLAGFTEQLHRANLEARAEVISASTLPAPRAAAVALGVPRGDPVHEIVRVRSAGGQPLALERSYFPAGIFGDLLEHDLTGSLYHLLTNCYEQRPLTATEFLEPVNPTETETQLLGLEPGIAVMLIERTAFTAAGLAVEYARDLFRPDRVRISVHSGWAAGAG
jgi:GntR family transcriptional regulator